MSQIGRTSGSPQNFEKVASREKYRALKSAHFDSKSQVFCHKGSGMY